MNPDPDSDPSIFITELQQKTNLKKKFACMFLFKGTCTSFSKIKSQKDVTKQ
jgi:hypothetical protein